MLTGQLRESHSHISVAGTFEDSSGPGHVMLGMWQQLYVSEMHAMCRRLRGAS